HPSGRRPTSKSSTELAGDSGSGLQPSDVRKERPVDTGRSFAFHPGFEGCQTCDPGPDLPKENVKQPRENTPVAARSVRQTANRAGRRVGRFFSRALAFAAIAVLVLLAVGDAAGRFRFVPTPEHTGGTAYSSSDLLVVAPVPSQRLKVGDVIIASNKNEHAL